VAEILILGIKSRWIELYNTKKILANLTDGLVFEQAKQKKPQRWRALAPEERWSLESAFTI
jgi:hypothetical protein